MIDWPTTGLTLRALTGDARSLSLADFEARYARAFLICHRAPSAAPITPMRTRSASKDGATGELVIVAYPLRRRPASEHPFIGIGRLEGNDVAIFDETLSKFHAYVKESAVGAVSSFVIQDAKSRNGTMVDEVSVAARGAGPPMPLAPGQRVRFGSVTTTFLLASGVIALVARASR